MQHKRILTMLAALAAAGPFSGAPAQEPGLLGGDHYFAIRGGAAWTDVDDVQLASPVTTGRETDEDSDRLAGLLGFAFGWKPSYRPLRFELEVAHRSGAESEHQFALDTTQEFTAPAFNREFVDVNSTTFLAKAFFERELSGMTVFAGGGIGAAWLDVEARETTVNAGTVAANRAFFNDDDSTEFAWALGAGFSGEVGRAGVFEVGYEYVSAGEFELRGAGGANQVANTSLLTGDVRNHNVYVGWRFD